MSESRWLDEVAKHIPDCACEGCLKARAVKILSGELIPTIRRVKFPKDSYYSFTCTILGFVEQASMLTMRMFDGKGCIVSSQQVFHATCGELNQSCSWPTFKIYDEVMIEAEIERRCQPMLLSVSALAQPSSLVSNRSRTIITRTAEE